MVAAPSLNYVDETDPVLAAAKRAPLVEWTAEEQALLDEVKGRPVGWIPTEQFQQWLERAFDATDEASLFVP